MNTFLKYFYEVLSQFFSGFITIFKGFIEGFKQIFNFKAYIALAKSYKGEFNVGEWVLFGVSVFLMLAFIALIVFLVLFIVRKYVRFRKTIVEQESMLEEISELNGRVATLLKEKE